MPIELKVRNFIRTQMADIVLDPIALLIGNNGQGKSSVAMAAALTATGQKLPPGFTMGRVKELITDEATSAEIAIGEPLGENEQKIEYPEGDVTTAGGPPLASPYAVGLVSLLDMTLKERAAALGDLIKSEPTKDDLKQAFEDEDIPAAAVDQIWGIISASVNGGWDKAHERSADRRAERKAEWKLAAGEDYGSDKARDWRPAGFTEDLAGATESDLEGAVTVAQAQLEDALKAQGGKIADLSHLHGLTDALGDRQEALATAETTLQQAAAAVETARKARAALPAGGKAEATPHVSACPHCGADVEIKAMGGGLAQTYHLADPKTSAKGKPDKATLLKMAAADGALSKAEGERMVAQTGVGSASAALKASEEAKALLEEMDRKPATDTDEAEESVRTARRAVDTARTRLTLWKAWSTTTKMHTLISLSDRVVSVLAPSGLRQKKLAASIHLFNASVLAPLSEAAGWPAVEFQPDMTVWYDGRPISSVTAKSFKARVRYLLSFACAQIDGSRIVVCDEADILDRDTGRKGLLQLAKFSEKAVLCCMTAWGAAVPDLSKHAGWGRTYVVENGAVIPFVAE